MELNDLLRIAGIGLVIGILHVFFEQTGKKEFSFFLFFIAYLYITAEMLRFLKIFFTEISEFFQWLVDGGLMFTLLQIIVVFLLLLLIAFAVPKLQPLLYTSIFFIVLCTC